MLNIKQKLLNTILGFLAHDFKELGVSPEFDKSIIFCLKNSNK